MADITMCNNKKCPVKETCYRYLAAPSQYQSYFIINTEEKCDEYWKCTSKEQREKLDKQWSDFGW